MNLKSVLTATASAAFAFLAFYVSDAAAATMIKVPVLKAFGNNFGPAYTRMVIPIPESGVTHDQASSVAIDINENGETGRHHWAKACVMPYDGGGPTGYPATKVDGIVEANTPLGSWWCGTVAAANSSTGTLALAPGLGTWLTAPLSYPYIVVGTNGNNIFVVGVSVFD